MKAKARMAGAALTEAEAGIGEQGGAVARHGGAWRWKRGACRAARHSTKTTRARNALMQNDYKAGKPRLLLSHAPFFFFRRQVALDKAVHVF
jgi:hypothetical protein